MPCAFLFGGVESRRELARLCPGPESKRPGPEAPGRTVRVYGNTAVATYKDTYDAVLDRQHRAGTIISTDVWVKMGSDWKHVSSQNTPTK